MSELEQLNERLDRLEKSVGELLGEMNARQILAVRREQHRLYMQEYRNGKTVKSQGRVNSQEKNEEGERSKGEEERKETPYNACAREGKFVPPTEDEVAAYCKAKGYAVDPVMFVSFYASKGWMIGKNKMKDWRRAVVTWTKRDEKEQNEKKKGVTHAANRRNVTAHQNCMLTDEDREAIPY